MVGDLFRFSQNCRTSDSSWAELSNTRGLSIRINRRDSSMSATCSSRWYVAQTQPHAEAKASLHLGRQGFEVFLPRYLKRRRHARRIETIAAPLYPGYLFVAIDLGTQRWRSIHSTIGISRLVCHGEEPAALPEAVVEELKRRQDDSGLIRLERGPRLNSGDKVRVLEGAFSDYLGLYEGMHERERVAILMDLLGRKVRIQLPAELVEAA
jgi:transcriptional antiterminator RfaH